MSTIVESFDFRQDSFHKCSSPDVPRLLLLLLKQRAYDKKMLNAISHGIS